MSRTRIVLLTHDTPFGRRLAARLAARFDLAGALVFERCAAPRRTAAARLRRLARRLRDGGESARLEATEARLAAAAEAMFDAMAGPAPGWSPEFRLHRTAAPCGAEATEWLRGLDAALLAVAGGPILRGPILTATRLGALNMHTSLLPAYRGSRPEFWQVHDGALETAGVTFHLLDAGVDTGPVILSVPTAAVAPIDPWLLRAHNLLAALDAWPDAIDMALSGNGARPQPSAGRARRMADITPEARRRVIEAAGLAPTS